MCVIFDHPDESSLFRQSQSGIQLAAGKASIDQQQSGWLGTHSHMLITP
jgi:hypothetical protein